MRALIVGLGSIGRRHARNWATLRLGDVWVCRQQGAPQPEALGVEARVIRDLDQALAAGPEVVIVSNPTSLHVETARQAIEAGAHVLVEKPLGHTLDGVAQLLTQSAARQRLVMVGYNLRFHPGLLRLRQLLHAGAIGQPLAARVEMGEYLPDWHPWEDYRHGYAARPRRRGDSHLEP
jgi:predicted dehydrogenase